MTCLKNALKMIEDFKLHEHSKGWTHAREYLKKRIIEEEALTFAKSAESLEDKHLLPNLLDPSLNK